MQREWVRFRKKLHNFSEKLHAILFEHDSMRAFAEFDEPFVRSVGQLGEVGPGLVARQVDVPLGVDQQGRDGLAYFNNDGAGHAVRNVRTLRALLGDALDSHGK